MVSVLRVFKTTRFGVAAMIFTASLINFIMNINMSLNLVVMMEPVLKNKNSTDDHPDHEHIYCGHMFYSGIKGPTEKNFGTKYKWGPTESTMIIASYFWGYTVSTLFGGPLAERFGPTKIVLIATACFGILTTLGPPLANASWIALMLSRAVIGLFAGVIFPCLHCLISKWAPPDEKGKFMTSLLGGPLGVVLGWSLIGAVISDLGWVWSFYINGITVLLWCILWYFTVTDTPAEHPRISEEEKLYIMASLGDRVAYKHLKTNLIALYSVCAKCNGTTQTWPPYNKILLSTPFWALVWLHFGNMWGLFFVMTAEPVFIKTILGIEIGKIGILASIPYIAKLITGFCFGATGDYLTTKKSFSRTTVRKAFVIFSHIIPGMFLYALIVTGCDIYWIIGVQTLSLGCNGAATITNLQNVQDLAPNYAATVSSIVGSIGTTPGILVASIVGVLTKDDECLHKWYICFSIGGSVYIITGIIFCIFGSGEIQPWNELPHREPIEEQTQAN